MGTKGGDDLQPLNYQTRISDIQVLVLSISIPMYAGVACFLGALSLASSLPRVNECLVRRATRTARVAAVSVAVPDED